MPNPNPTFFKVPCKLISYLHNANLVEAPNAPRNIFLPQILLLHSFQGSRPTATRANLNQTQKILFNSNSLGWIRGCFKAEQCPCFEFVSNWSNFLTSLPLFFVFVFFFGGGGLLFFYFSKAWQSDCELSTCCTTTDKLVWWNVFLSNDWLRHRPKNKLFYFQRGIYSVSETEKLKKRRPVDAKKEHIKA